MLCDASILVPIFLPEKASGNVESFFQKHKTENLVSDFSLGEFASTVSVKLRRGDITLAHAERVLTDFDIWVSRQAKRVVTEPSDIVLATSLVRRFDLALRMPDALYLALAIRLNLAFATLDQRQASAGRALGLRILEP